MANPVRLRHNMIIENKLHVRGSTVDEALIPPNFRNATYIDDLEARHGLVLLLRDLNFSTQSTPDSDGIATSYPARVSRGELFDLGRVPQSQRERLQEAVDYKSAWTHQEFEEMQREQSDIYAQQLVAEPVIENR